jgi:hypothetical protein
MRRTTELTLHVVAVAVALIGLVLLLGACSDDDGEVTVSGDRPAARIDLTVVGGTDDDPAAWTRRLVCDADGTTGEGIDDPDAACAAVRSGGGRAALFPGTDRMCTQVYGGPEVAVVSGDLEGQPVQATIRRSDGCGIADWEALQAVLPAPVARAE